MSKPSFGFGSLSDLADIKPSAAPPPAARRPEAIDRAGEKLGFASREATVRRRRRPPLEEPTDQINIRAAIADINRFVEWCEKERLSYREGFSKLVAQLDRD
jgi:hypothetical protein